MQWHLWNFFNFEEGGGFGSLRIFFFFLQNLIKIPTIVIKTCFWKLIFVYLHIWNHIFFYILKKSHDRKLRFLSSKNLEKIVKQVMAKLFYKRITSRPPPPISLKMSFILIRWTPILINCPYKLSKCRIIVLCRTIITVT